MRMNRYMVCLFQGRIDNNSQARVVFALTPEQALAQALKLPSVDGIKYAGKMDGIAFYEHNGEEHIVHMIAPAIGQ